MSVRVWSSSERGGSRARLRALRLVACGSIAAGCLLASAAAADPGPLVLLPEGNQFVVRRALSSQKPSGGPGEPVAFVLPVVLATGVDAATLETRILAVVRDGAVQLLPPDAIAAELGPMPTGLDGNAARPRPAAIEPQRSTQPALRMTIDFQQLFTPGTYDIQIVVAPRGPAAAAALAAAPNAPPRATPPVPPREPQQLTIRVTIPAASLRTIPAIVVEREVSPFGTESAPPHLVFREAGGQSPVALSVSQDGPLVINDHPISGTVAVSQLVAIGAGTSGSAELTLAGDFPVGTAKGTLLVAAHELAAPLSIPIEVRSRRPSWMVLVLFAIGTVVGALWRTTLRTRRDRLARELTAADLEARIDAELAVQPTAWEGDVADLRTKRAAIDPNKPESLRSAEAALTAACDLRAGRIKALRSEITVGLETTHTRWELPMGLDLATAARSYEAASANLQRGAFGDAVKDVRDGADEVASVIERCRRWVTALDRTVQGIGSDVPGCPAAARPAVRGAIEHLIEALHRAEDAAAGRRTPAMDASSAHGPMSARRTGKRANAEPLDGRHAEAPPPRPATRRSELDHRAAGAFDGDPPGGDDARSGDPAERSGDDLAAGTEGVQSDRDAFVARLAVLSLMLTRLAEDELANRTTAPNHSSPEADHATAGTSTPIAPDATTPDPTVAGASVPPQDATVTPPQDATAASPQDATATPSPPPAATATPPQVATVTQPTPADGAPPSPPVAEPGPDSHAHGSGQALAARGAALSSELEQLLQEGLANEAIALDSLAREVLALEDLALSVLVGKSTTETSVAEQPTGATPARRQPAPPTPTMDSAAAGSPTPPQPAPAMRLVNQTSDAECLAAMHEAWWQASELAAALSEGLEAFRNSVPAGLPHAAALRAAAMVPAPAPEHPDRAIEAAVEACRRLSEAVTTAARAIRGNRLPADVAQAIRSGDYASALSPCAAPGDGGRGGTVAGRVHLLLSEPPPGWPRPERVLPAPATVIVAATSALVTRSRRSPAVIRARLGWVTFGRWVIAAAVTSTAAFAFYGDAFVGTAIESFGVFVAGFVTDLTSDTVLEALLGKFKQARSLDSPAQGTPTLGAPG